MVFFDPIYAQTLYTHIFSAKPYIRTLNFSRLRREPYIRTLKTLYTHKPYIRTFPPHNPIYALPCVYSVYIYANNPGLYVIDVISLSSVLLLSPRPPPRTGPNSLQSHFLPSASVFYFKSISTLRPRGGTSTNEALWTNLDWQWPTNIRTFSLFHEHSATSM